MNDDPIVGFRLITHNVRLIRARKAKGYDQATLGRIMNRCTGWISQVENLWLIPSEDQMVQLAVCLEQPIDYLFPEELLNAIRAQVFCNRYKEIGGPELVSLTEAEVQRLSYDDDYLLEEPARQELSEKIGKVLSTLTPREQRVLELRYGLAGNEEAKTLQEIGVEFDVHRQTIKYVEDKALRKLRHPSRKRQLEGYLE